MTSFVVPRETASTLVQLRDVMDDDWRCFYLFCQTAGSVRCIWRQGLNFGEIASGSCRTGRHRIRQGVVNEVLQGTPKPSANKD